MKWGNFLLFVEIYDDIHTVFDTQIAGIQTNIIVLCRTPGTTGIVLIIDLTAFVLLSQARHGGLFAFAVKAYNTICAVFLVSMDVDIQHIIAVLEDIVSVTAYNDTGALLSKLQNHAALDAPQEVSGG